MNKFKAALSATGVIIVVVMVCTLMALLANVLWILFLIFGLGFIWWSFYNAFKK
jgi:hypothetical protein